MYINKYTHTYIHTYKNKHLYINSVCIVKQQQQQQQQQQRMMHKTYACATE